MSLPSTTKACPSCGTLCPRACKNCRNPSCSHVFPRKYDLASRTAAFIENSDGTERWLGGSKRQRVSTQAAAHAGRAASTSAVAPPVVAHPASTAGRGSSPNVHPEPPQPDYPYEPEEHATIAAFPAGPPTDSVNAATTDSNDAEQSAYAVPNVHDRDNWPEYLGNVQGNARCMSRVCSIETGAHIDCYAVSSGLVEENGLTMQVTTPAWPCPPMHKQTQHLPSQPAPAHHL
jgi:hypothetical protein